MGQYAIPLVGGATLVSLVTLIVIGYQVITNPPPRRPRRARGSSQPALALIANDQPAAMSPIDRLALLSPEAQAAGFTNHFSPLIAARIYQLEQGNTSAWDCTGCGAMNVNAAICPICRAEAPILVAVAA